MRLVMCSAAQAGHQTARVDALANPDIKGNLEQTFYEAEKTGLRLAIKGRIVALILLGAYLVSSRIDESLTRAINYALATGAFAALGGLHYITIGSTFDRAWLKYAFVTIDLVILSALVATQPLFPTADVPQAMIFRDASFVYYFVVLGLAAFSFSPGMVLWTGAVGVAGWLGAFSWAVRDMSQTLDWSDIAPDPTTEELLSVLNNVNFVGTGSRVQESTAYFVVATLIAVVVVRARRTVKRQLELDEERRTITEVFGQYVPKTIADALISDRGALEPVERNATILFADIAGFTTMTEEEGAQKIVRVLNAYFDDATRIISEHDGVITQFQGDAILATFNVPLEDPKHAARAVEAALEIQALLQSKTFDALPIRARVGICTGPVVAGSVGGGGRQNYTVHGNTVNLAARLEALNKEYGTDVLVTESTVTLADGKVGGTTFKRIGAINVRGFAQAVAIYTPAKQQRVTR